MTIKWNPSSLFWRLGMYTGILVEYRIFRDSIKYIYIYIYIYIRKTEISSRFKNRNENKQLIITVASNYG